MASITELIQAAQALQKPNTVAMGMQALATGLKTQREIQGQRLDRALRYLEFSEKIKQAEQDEVNNRIRTNFAKRLGLLDYDQNEKDAARQVANDNLGKNSVKVASRDKTQAGKINKMFTQFDTNDYDMLPTFSMKDGLGFSFKKKPAVKGQTPAQLRQGKKDVYDLAVKMATTAERDRRAKKGEYEGMAQNDFRFYIPPQDEIEKYKPIASKYLLGDENEYKRLLKAKQDSERDEEDILGDPKDWE